MGLTENCCIKACQQCIFMNILFHVAALCNPEKNPCISNINNVFSFVYWQSATIIIGLSWQNILIKYYYTQNYIVLEIHQYIVEFYFHQANSQYFVDHSMNCRQQQEMSVLVWLIFCVNVAHSTKLCITPISNKWQ